MYKMPHSKFKDKNYEEGTGIIICTCGQTFNYASEREVRMKIRLHNKFCPNPSEDTSIDGVSNPINVKKSMTLKEFYKNEAEETRKLYENII